MAEEKTLFEILHKIDRLKIDRLKINFKTGYRFPKSNFLSLLLLSLQNSYKDIETWKL